MKAQDLEQLFEQQAASYDQQWARIAPIQQALHMVLQAVFAPLPEDARILCVGAGTGSEIESLAKRHPGWSFLAVDPAPAMLERCRAKAEKGEYGQRLQTHTGYVNALPARANFDGATSFLVSQFLLQRSERVAYFADIAQRLRPGGILASSDLTADVQDPRFEGLLQLWLSLMSAADPSPQHLEQMRKTYTEDVGVRPATEVESILLEGGFLAPLRIYQAALIQAWAARKA